MSTVDTVVAYFAEILRRQPTDAESSTWVARIEDAADRNQALDDLCAHLLAQADDVRSILRLYQTVFDRVSDPGGLSFWVAVFRKIQADNPGLSHDAVLAKTIAHWSSSDEYIARYGANLSDVDFVEALYRNALGRASDEGGLNFWLSELRNGIIDRERMVVLFSESDELKARADVNANAVLKLAAQLASPETGDDPSTSVPGDNPFQGMLGNNAPVAVDDAASGNEDTAIMGNVLDNDSDPDGDSLSVTEVNGAARSDNPIMLPSGARLTIAADGSYTYEPAADFNGSDSFTYTVSDGQGGTAMATATLTVGAGNDAPVAVDDAASGDEDTTISGNVLGNDSDPDGDSLSVTEVNGAARSDNPIMLPSGARLTIAADGSYTYEPAADFNGSDSFTYTVSDGRGGTATATATLTVGAVNDAPVAVDDAASGNENTAIMGNVLDNDSDPDGDALSVTQVNGDARTDDPVILPSGARLTIAADGSYTYEPVAGFNGSDSFTYTVSDGRGGEAQATVDIEVAGIPDRFGFVINGIDENDGSGLSVSSAGDVNGDGVDDVIIGAVGADPNGNSRAGESYVVFGTRGGFDASLDLSSLNGSNGFVINGIDVGDVSGSSVSSAGDVNGDGVDDVIIGAPFADPNGNETAGESYVVFGTRDGFGRSLDLSSLNGSNGFVINGIDADDQSGRRSVSSAGDVNGDGVDDLIIGAFGADPNGNQLAGESYVVFGTRDGFGASLDLSSLNGGNGFVIKGIDAVDRSGLSVSSAGDVNGDDIDDLIIGAKDADPNGNESAGESYVVFGTRSGFGASLDLSSLNGSNGFVINGIDADDISGWSVSGAGDVNGDTVDDIIIAAPGADQNGNQLAGESYVVFGTRDGFDASLDLSSLNGGNGFVIKGIDAGDRLGASVSGAGDVNGDGIDDLIIGAENADPNGNQDAGKSYVVFGTRSGFGASLDLSSLDGSNGFVFNGIDADDFSGVSVSRAGDVNDDGVDDLIIGATGADPNGDFRAGESYIVYGGADSLAAFDLADGTQDGTIDLSLLGAVNGVPVAVDDAASGNENTAIMGSVLDNDSDPDGDSLSVTEVNGAARTDDPVTLPSGARLTIAADGSYTYEPVADFNGSDSFTYTVSDGQGGEAQATVEIAVTGITDRFGFVIPGIDADDFSGISVSSAGDVNGDGVDDLIIGATGADPNGIQNAGESYVVFGTRGGFGASLDLSSLNGSNGFVINGIDAFDQPGFSVSSAGDVNGDGFDDLIIGAQGADPNGNQEAGESYVVFGTRGGFDASLDLSSLNGSNGFVINGIDTNDKSGDSVSSAGDVNGDGFDDLIIGAPSAEPNDIFGAGESYVVFGARDGFGPSLDLSSLNGSNGFVIKGIDRQNFSGDSVSSAGDVNGDGFDDLFIGAFSASPNGNRQAGESYVVFGTGGGFDASLDLSSLNGSNGFVINGIDVGDLSGFSVSSAGDVNGDGLGDLIIGAYLADPNGNQNAGESYVVFGTRDGFDASLDLSSLNGSNGFVINGIDADDWSGRSVSSAGDVNGDGVDDVIIGAIGADPNGNQTAGESYVVFGMRGGFDASLDLSSLNGSNGFVINGIDADDRSGESVSGAGDINGDGVDDLIIGAIGADPNGNESAGESYIVYGGADSLAAFDLADGTQDGTIDLSLLWLV